MRDHELHVASNGAEYVPYNEPGYPVYAGKGWLHSFKNMGAIDHWHWDIELIFVLTGEVSFTVNQKTVTIHEGEGIFINSGQIHRNYSLDGTDGEYRCVLIHPSALQTSFQKAAQDQQELYSNSRIPFSVLQPEISWQRIVIEDINALYERILSGIEDNLFSILSSAFDLIHTLLRNLPHSDNDVHNLQNLNSMREMMGFIQTHFSEKIAVSDISRAGKVGNSTCHTLFRRFLRMTPMAYLLDYRIEKAAQVLENTKNSVAEIAEMTGFISPSYFAECFKAKYGTSPSGYRKRVKSEY